MRDVCIKFINNAGEALAAAWREGARREKYCARDVTRAFTAFKVISGGMLKVNHLQCGGGVVAARAWHRK